MNLTALEALIAEGDSAADLRRGGDTNQVGTGRTT